ncbi:MAG TPA: Do family serine endopeptidase [Longimicrobiaceae bacterium]|nr:Do family serine endopeptidase [Longimicrobiaceae bacterium]
MLDPVRAKARVIAFTLVAFIGGVMLASGMNWTAGSHAATLLQTTPTKRAVQPVAELSQSFVAIADAVTPAVVSIRTEMTQSLPSGHPEIPEPFRRFFNIPPGGEPESTPSLAMGSGFILSSDGYIMTNNHVVADADKVTVVLNDRREFPARVVGHDPTTDVAVIKIDATGLPTVSIGDPEGSRVGEWVLAIGNPLGLSFTVTAGIISAKGRPLQIISQSLREQGNTNPGLAVEDFIQTDAAINPGNSGGPLVNTRGQVIGINSAIASETGYYAGYGFAIPIDLARRVADDLIKYGHVRRPVLGIVIREVDPEDAEVYHLPTVSGALVEDFGQMPNNPAQAAGLQRNDVIVAVNGHPVDRVNELQRLIIEQHPGDIVTLDVIRNGKRMKVPVRLTEAPAPTPESTAAAPSPATPPSEGRLGIRVAPLTAELAQKYHFDQPGGVVITGAAPYGPAGRKGVGEGLKVVSADGHAIRTPEDLQSVVDDVPANGIISLVLQDPSGTHVTANIRVAK